MDWDKLKTFHAAAQAGSLTRAAEMLGLSQSAVSRQIAALEDDLGVTLFHRHARGLIPTEPGNLLYEAAREIHGKVAVAEARVHDARDEPSGELKVTAPTALGAIWLASRLSEFHDQYPNIRIRLMLDDHELDLAGLEAEVGIRPWASTQNDLVQRKLLAVRQHLYASHEYLERHGRPQTPEDLDDHSIIHYGPPQLAPIPGLDWAAKAGREAGAPPRPAVVEVNTIYGVMKTVEAGMGIAALPDYVARENPRLERVLPELVGPDFEVYFVYPSELRGSRRIVAFRDFLIEQARRWQS
ncbi:MAG: LysR family transcriptional regulator [Maricaulis sp.]|jgi:DNA-binding transcriptional LysR family regulator|uniref:LysR family transcriptional regulator n=1 Tax=Maricaulis virginensis TaxID=144022 RepID=A0A9W6IRK3_9PROT|nr:LysR family transcriptional regulator [Maricaulis virginensis]MAZ90787.1 LysR family transcriptional regulator [Maricaulis sp.]GLK53826.1 LysR family transcriptional regulator [Maricaulis virginensis]